MKPIRTVAGVTQEAPKQTIHYDGEVLAYFNLRAFRVGEPVLVVPQKDDEGNDVFPTTRERLQVSLGLFIERCVTCGNFVQTKNAHWWKDTSDERGIRGPCCWPCYCKWEAEHEEAADD